MAHSTGAEERPDFFFTWDASGDLKDPQTIDAFAARDRDVIFDMFSTTDKVDPLLGSPGQILGTDNPQVESWDDRWTLGWRYWVSIPGTTSTMSLDVTINPDPVVDATLTVTNNSDFDQTFCIYMPLAISPAITPQTIMRGSVSIALSDQDGDGATLSATATRSIYSAFIDDDPNGDTNEIVRTMLDPGYSLTASASQSSSDGLTFSNQIGPAANTQIALKLIFTLSPHDSASITGVFEVTPTPAAWPILALLGFAKSRRRKQ